MEDSVCSTARPIYRISATSRPIFFYISIYKADSRPYEIRYQKKTTVVCNDNRAAGWRGERCVQVCPTCSGPEQKQLAPRADWVRAQRRGSFQVAWTAERTKLLPPPLPGLIRPRTAFTARALWAPVIRGTSSRTSNRALGRPTPPSATPRTTGPTDTRGTDTRESSLVLGPKTAPTAALTTGTAAARALEGIRPAATAGSAAAQQQTTQQHVSPTRV